ncbi:MAG: zinc ribbon domain-containing protein [Roseiarcus sp.]
MPLFAYRCRACGEEFQTLVMSGETPLCKACDSADLEQRLSLIASPNKGGETSAREGGELALCGAEMGACCGGGACGAFADA